MSRPKEPRIEYFAYGAMRHGDVIRAVIGEGPVGEQVRLHGMKLCVQRIDQVPERAQIVLRRSWSDTFRSYTITPDPGGFVSGVMWTITKPQLKLIRNWELVELGWFDQIEVEVTAGRRIVPAMTEVMGKGQDFDHEVDGTNYISLLNPLDRTVALASRIREEFLAKV